MDRGWKVGTTVKFMALVPVPPGVVTLILPVTAPTGTAAVICVAEFTTKLARAPPNRTSVAPVKAVPVIVTAVPVLPRVGENEEIVGLVAVPLVVFAVIGPVVAPVGTSVTICVAVFNVLVAITPLNFTQVAPVRLVPLIV